MRILTTFLFCTCISTQAIAADESNKAVNSRAAELAVRRANLERIENEVSGIVRLRLAEIRRENGSRLMDSRPKGAGQDYSPSEKGAHAGHEAHWTYEGETGPARWGKLNPAWAKCDAGARQSPIDIRDGIKVDLEPVVFDYKPSHFNVLDNGHTVQVNVGTGNRITLTGRSYELVQFHFHRPAEEKVDGRAFEMVAHLVHKDPDGRLAVVAVLIDSGSPHGLVQTVWNNLPLEKNDPLVPTITLDPNQLLPQRREYYTFMGSLTTPPCSEGVLWIVMKEAIQVSAQQIGIFARLYPMNARPIQPDSGRLIKESN